MTLDAVAFDVAVRVVSCDGLSISDRDRLSGLGLRRGVAVIKLLKTPLRDPIECLVGSQLLAIETRLLSLIRVEAF